MDHKPLIPGKTYYTIRKSQIVPFIPKGVVNSDSRIWYGNNPENGFRMVCDIEEMEEDPSDFAMPGDRVTVLLITLRANDRGFTKKGIFVKMYKTGKHAHQPCVLLDGEKKPRASWEFNVDKVNPKVARRRQKEPEHA